MQVTQLVIQTLKTAIGKNTLLGLGVLFITKKGMNQMIIKIERKENQRNQRNQKNK